MTKKLLIAAVLLAAALTLYLTSTNSSEDEEKFLTTTPVSGAFAQTIFASGELKAKKSLKIRAPQGMRAADIWQTQIEDLVTEGTYVNKGDYVGSLDRSELAGKISDVNSQIETEMTKLEQTKIDTAISIKEIRDQIADVLFNIKNEKLEMEKNQYEPDMVLEQSRINLEKSERSLQQLKNKEELIKIQSVAKVQEVEGAIKQLQSKLQIMTKLSGEFSITAPESGMLIYARTWNGKKSVGSQISSWDPVVAELPDLSKMISVAYVNEVDISKVSKGQLVDIQVDAFPEKAFTGQIIKVANIGQELRNQDAKVFEITIEVDQEDEVMKPAMTTSNTIKIYDYPEVVSIPLEAYYSDSLDYVIVKNGNDLVKQEVVSGPFNEDHIIIVTGIDASNELLLSRSSKKELPYQVLTEKEKLDAKIILEKWKEEKESYDQDNLEKVKGDDANLPQNAVASNMVIIG